MGRYQIDTVQVGDLVSLRDSQTKRRLVARFIKTDVTYELLNIETFHCLTRVSASTIEECLKRCEATYSSVSVLGKQSHCVEGHE